MSVVVTFHYNYNYNYNMRMQTRRLPMNIPLLQCYADTYYNLLFSTYSFNIYFNLRDGHVAHVIMSLCSWFSSPSSKAYLPDPALEQKKERKLEVEMLIRELWRLWRFCCKAGNNLVLLCVDVIGKELKIEMTILLSCTISGFLFLAH